MKKLKLAAACAAVVIGLGAAGCNKPTGLPPKVRQEIANLTAERDKATNQVSTLVDEKILAIGEIASLKDQRDKATNLVASLMAERDDLANQLAATNLVVAGLQGQITALDRQATSLPGLIATNIAITAERDMATNRVAMFWAEIKRLKALVSDISKLTNAPTTTAAPTNAPVAAKTATPTVATKTSPASAWSPPTGLPVTFVSSSGPGVEFDANGVVGGKSVQFPNRTGEAVSVYIRQVDGPVGVTLFVPGKSKEFNLPLGRYSCGWAYDWGGPTKALDDFVVGEKPTRHDDRSGKSFHQTVEIAEKK